MYTSPNSFYNKKTSAGWAKVLNYFISEGY
jgi:hypothetical protein